MKRYPDGVEGQHFFEKRCPEHRPDFVGTVRLGREGKEKVVDHCNIGDVASLVWVANLASLELHTSLARKPDTFTPTMVKEVFRAKSAGSSQRRSTMPGRNGLNACPLAGGSG